MADPVGHARYLTSKQAICEDDAPLLSDLTDAVYWDNLKCTGSCKDCFDLLKLQNDLPSTR